MTCMGWDDGDLFVGKPWFFLVGDFFMCEYLVFFLVFLFGMMVKHHDVFKGCW